VEANGTVGPLAAPARGIVTPEAVVLEFETAGIGSRVLAKVIDLLVQGTALFAIGVLLGVSSIGDAVPTAVGIIVVVVMLFLIVFGYPIGLETFWGGRTLGKAAFGLRVVTVEGAPIQFRHAAIRGALGLFDFYIPPGGVFAVLSVLLTPRNQRLGDLAAATLVLRERTAAPPPVPVTFSPPWGWDDYVASLDVSALTAEQYGLIRSFLLRTPQLSPAARWHLAQRLAGPVAALLHHTAPPQATPELFLVCVASAYQRRHGWTGPPAAPVVPPGWGPPPTG
jgi:uncharacterized RDD family membrane protein YckC